MTTHLGSTYECLGQLYVALVILADLSDDEAWLALTDVAAGDQLQRLHLSI